MTTDTLYMYGLMLLLTILQAINYDEILDNVKQRDYIDSHRETAPLRQADDALVLDNSNMTIPEQNAWLLEKAKARMTE